MGMYTGLRGKVFLKDKYISKIEEQLNSCDGFYWELILPEENKYNNYSRNSFIPNGVVCYMPHDWDDKVAALSGNVLEFCCSLKDYNHTINMFLTECLPEIALGWELEELYEEDEESTFHVKDW